MKSIFCNSPSARTEICLVSHTNDALHAIRRITRTAFRYICALFETESALECKVGLYEITCGSIPSPFSGHDRCRLVRAYRFRRDSTWITTSHASHRISVVLMRWTRTPLLNVRPRLRSGPQPTISPLLAKRMAICEN